MAAGDLGPRAARARPGEAGAAEALGIPAAAAQARLARARRKLGNLVGGMAGRRGKAGGWKEPGIDFARQLPAPAERDLPAAYARQLTDRLAQEFAREAVPAPPP